MNQCRKFPTMYVQGTKQYMIWRDIFQESDLVKNANAADLDTNVADALVVAGFRIDNPAAAWVSKANIKASELKGCPISKIAAARVDEACSLFGITDDQFQLKDTEGYKFFVKEAGLTADFCILTQESFNQAVQAVFEKRANAPLSFCQKCAEALLDVKSKAGYTLSSSDDIRLFKMASRGDFNSEAASEAIKSRAEFARVYLKDTTIADSLDKLASVCASIPRTDNKVISFTVATSVDEFDRKHNLMGKYASHRVKPIEEIIYLTHDEALAKEASELVELDDVRTMTKLPFINPDTCDAMAKWASDNGYATTSEADDIIDCVSSMSESLREEFVQTFGNL